MNQGDDETEKTLDPTPQKLEQARKKGEVPRSADLSVAASYGGFLLAALGLGAVSVENLGTTMMVLLDQADALAPLMVSDGAAAAPIGGIITSAAWAVLPWFLIPMLAVVLSVLAQRSFTMTLSKVQPKLSRISPLENAKNKFGRNGLFEFSKSTTKLLIYCVILGFFLEARMDEMVSAINSGPALVTALLGQMCIEFLFVVLLISIVIGGIDAVWQYHEHIRKNRMSRKEMMDEMKQSEGDPYLKQERRQRGMQIANSQMMAEVPKADVVIVNPTHYAVALKWSRKRGEVPVCVAKGVDELAKAIREMAMEHGVPIQSDPPIARAIYDTIDLGQEIDVAHYQGVAAAIRFAEDMRRRAKQGAFN